MDPSAHAMLINGGVREVDFKLSTDSQFVEKSNEIGLSFATNMRKFKKLVKTKARFHSEVDVYVIEDVHLMCDGLRLIHDKPGHASLVVTKRMKTSDLITKLETIARRMEAIGRIKVSP